MASSEGRNISVSSVGEANNSLEWIVIPKAVNAKINTRQGFMRKNLGVFIPVSSMTGYFLSIKEKSAQIVNIVCLSEHNSLTKRYPPKGIRLLFVNREKCGAELTLLRTVTP